MEIFWRLLFGHLLSDFTCQTDYVAAWKRRSIWGLFFHVSTHPLFYVLLTWPYVNDIWVRSRWAQLNGWTCIALIYITHLFEDEWRIWSVIKRGAPDNFLFYLWDQIIHIVIIFAVAPLSTPLFKTVWPLLGSLAVLVTHFATVTVYFVEKDFFGKDFPRAFEKYASMAARLTVFACFFLPGYAWLLVVAVWALQTTLGRKVPVLAFSKTNLLLGNGIAVVCGLLGRFVYLYL